MKRLYILLFSFRIFEVLKQVNKPFGQVSILQNLYAASRL